MLNLKKYGSMNCLTENSNNPFLKSMAQGNSNRGSVTTWSGGMEREMRGSFKKEGIYVYLQLIHVEV